MEYDSLMEKDIIELSKALAPVIYNYYRHDKISKDLGDEQIQSLVARETYAQALAIWIEIDNQLNKRE